MVDFATAAPEFAKAITEAHRIEAYKKRWNRKLDELNASDRKQGHGRGFSIFPRCATERRREFLRQAMDAARAEGITLDEWVRAQRIDPALYERAAWAGLDDELTVMEGRRGRPAA